MHIVSLQNQAPEKSTSVISRLTAIEEVRRPLYKIHLSAVEGFIGRLLFRKAPPCRGDKPLLHLGCGSHHFSGWVNADYYRFSDLLRKRRRGLPDWMLDIGKPWRCAADYWEGIHTEHTLEHLDYRAVICALTEAHRTLKLGKWIRVVLPSASEIEKNGAFRYRSEALAHLTQGYGHVSVWDAELMRDLLTEIGFTEVKETAFGRGSDPEIVKDLPERAKESFYIEARK